MSLAILLILYKSNKNF